MARKKLEWHKVTPLSKGIAMAVFIIFPIVAFWLGILYQRSLTPLSCFPR